MCLGGLFLIPAAGGVGRMLYLRYIDREPGMVVALLVAMPGLYLVLGALQKKIVLFRDRVEIHGALCRRTLLRADIAGRRTKTYFVRRKMCRIIYLVPRQDDKSSIKLIDTGDWITTDSVFEQWMGGLADLGTR